MRKVRILQLELENFKGLPCFSVQFDDRLTQVVGSNGVGKTTLHDAYLWLLLGIDSANRAAFAVQPLDENGKTVNHLTTSVIGTFSFDGATHVLKRSLHQVWTRRRGTKEDVLTGNETEYFVDNVPYKASEFSSWVTKMFCPVEDFKLVSSLRAFGQLDMKAKRRKLIQMAGAMPELINPTDYPRLSVYYETVKNVEAIRKQVKYEMDGLKTKQAAIPIKITENERDMPTGIDFDSIRSQIAERQAEIEKIDARLQKDAESKSGLFSEAEALNGELKAVNAELLEIETQLASQRTRRMAEVSENVSKLNAKLNDLTNSNRRLIRDAEDLEARINNAEERKKELGRQWVAKNAETFPDGVVTECPTCHRPFDEEDIVKARNEAVRAFNAGKVAVLSRIEQEGDEIVKKLAKYREELDDVNALLENGNQAVRKATEERDEAKRQMDEIPTLENLKEFNKEYCTILSKKRELTSKALAATPQDDPDVIAIKNRKEALKKEISALTFELAKEQNIEKVNRRRQELEHENEELATRIGQLDGVLYEIMCYQKAYIELVERQVSSMFKLVTWKMYSKNITNDGETEICECLVDGVPVSTNVNTAGAVNAGIDIVNALSNWLDVSFPLWIDGKESVVELIDTEAQVITLKVVENSELKVL